MAILLLSLLLSPSSLSPFLSPSISPFFSRSLSLSLPPSLSPSLSLSFSLSLSLSLSPYLSPSLVFCLYLCRFSICPQSLSFGRLLCVWRGWSICALTQSSSRLSALRNSNTFFIWQPLMVCTFIRQTVNMKKIFRVLNYLCLEICIVLIFSITDDVTMLEEFAVPKSSDIPKKLKDKTWNDMSFLNKVISCLQCSIR
jgi:hypothetical protein